MRSRRCWAFGRTPPARLDYRKFMAGYSMSEYENSILKYMNEMNKASGSSLTPGQIATGQAVPAQGGGGGAGLGALVGLAAAKYGLPHLGLGGAGAGAIAPVAAAPMELAAPSMMLPGATSAGATTTALGGSTAPVAGLGAAIPLAAAGAVLLGDKWVPQTIGKYGKKIAQGIFGKSAEYNYNPALQVKNDRRIGTQVKDWGALSQDERIKMMDAARGIGALSWQGRDEATATPSINFSRFFGNGLFGSNSPKSPQQSYATARGAAIYNGTYVPTRDELVNNTNMTAGAKDRYLKLFDMINAGKPAAPAPVFSNDKVVHYVKGKTEGKK